MARKFRRMLDSSSDPTTFIGEGTRIEGTISGKGNCVVCGEVIGDCDIDGPVTISVTGHWHGTIKASDTIIAGAIDGDVRAEGHLEVASTARINGNVSGAAIAVARGAIIDGRIKVTGDKDDVMSFEEKRVSDPSGNHED
ncbi:MAG: polymer-forming cytoskeletal protein [Gammaproteobacteria bacterium]